MPDVRLPDFNDLITLAREIGHIKTELKMDKNRLDVLLAEITNVTSENEDYFINGRPPSMAYTEANYHKRGYNEETRKELERLRANIAKNKGKLREKEMMMNVYRDMIDVWRTQSANERMTTFEGG